MKPADDPTVDYRRLVREGYDRCSARYAEARRRESGRELELLAARLTPGSRVLDLGCGAGVPIAAALAREHRVTGVDVSSEQIRRARASVPGATFLLADAMAVEFPPESFAAVVSFYAVFHLPREEHEELFRRVHRWLAPGGYLAATVSHDREAAYTEDGFFGVRMYWSNWSREDYVEMLARLGFELLETSAIGHGYDAREARKPESHPLLFARKRERT
jgi:cyclopropane fatty-acyl-phospholipid synthase-like methyltransferase